MFKQTLLVLALAGSLFTVGCGGGGGGGSDDGGSGGSGSTETRNSVQGPLDAVQAPLSQQVIAPLASAVAGTPLEGAVECVDQIVVGDVLDVVDVLASGVNTAANPAALQAALLAQAANVQAELGDLVADLQGLIVSLAGQGACGASGTSLPGLGGSNPLTGTNFASLGAILGQLQGVQGQLDGAALPIGTLTGLLGQVAQAFNGAIPAGVRNTPVVGPSLDLVSQALADVQLALTEAASGDITGTTTALTTTVENLLDTVLTEVIPLGQLEAGAGNAGAISGVIQQLVDTLTSSLGGNLGNGLSLGSLQTLLAGNFEDVLDAVPVFGPILDQIFGALDPLSGSTPLATVLTTLTSALTGNQLLNQLLGPILGGVGSGTGPCQFQGIPILGTLLCGIL